MCTWVRGWRRIPSVAAISCVALAASLAAAYAQSFNITNLTQNTASKASFPTMVVDANGNLNLAWVDSSAGIKFLRSTTSGSGASFGAPATAVVVPNSAPPALPAFQPQMAVNPTAPNEIEITWAAPDPVMTSLYDVFASFSNNSGANFATSTNISALVGPVALFDSPRVAFDSTGTVNVVWGRTGVWISQASDGVHFGPPISLIQLPPAPAPDTGGPRITVSGAGHIFVVWTDEASKSATGSFCTGAPSTSTIGGNFWINETMPTQPPTPPSFPNTRNLSNSDWASPNRLPGDIQRFPNGFFGCSYDNLKLYTDKLGNVHLVWSDDSPDQDVLNSKTLGTANGFTTFSFPINIASSGAAAPDAAVDKSGTIYVVWSGDATQSSNSQGIFFSRSDDGGGNFTSCAPGQPLCGAINIAPKGSMSPAFPHIAVDSNSNVNVVWEQPTAALKGDGTDMFNVFFARSADKQTFPTVLQVTTSPSTLCFEKDPPPVGNNTVPTTPDMSTCGTVQIGVDANSIPDMVWVNQASVSAAADIDLATPAFPTGTLSATTVSLSSTATTANVTITMSQNSLSGPINFSCLDTDPNTNGQLPSWLTCTFNPKSLDTSQSTTDTLTFNRQGTPTASSFMSAPSWHILGNYGRPMAASLAFAAFCLVSMTMLVVRRRTELSAAFVMRGVLVMTLALVLAAGLVSCGGSTSSPSTTSTTGTSGSGGSGGTGGSGGGSTVTVHVAVMAQSGSAAAMNLGTVTVNAQ